MNSNITLDQITTNFNIDLGGFKIINAGINALTDGLNTLSTIGNVENRCNIYLNTSKEFTTEQINTSVTNLQA